MNKIIHLTFLLTSFALPCTGISEHQPANPNASAEARALLSYLYDISGTSILSGQHNAPLNGSNRLAGMHKQVGVYPAVFGQDFGFSEPGSWDGINFRQNIVDEAIKRHSQGFINTLMWHAVLPTHDEPQQFSNSVQGRLTDSEWAELLTPRSPLNERWKFQVDVVAWHLKQLDYAGVPILWRPYHEMNGPWFWWGGRPGKDGFNQLWIMLYKRLTEFHRLNNLIWVWNSNEEKQDVGPHADFFPGHAYVDVLATDVYTENYTQKNYEDLLILAKGKPIGLGEVGKFPSPEILDKQARWTWFMSWRDPDNFFWNDGEELQALFKYEKTLSLDELPWVESDNGAIKLHAPILK